MTVQSGQSTVDETQRDKRERRRAAINEAAGAHQNADVAAWQRFRDTTSALGEAYDAIVDAVHGNIRYEDTSRDTLRVYNSAVAGAADALETDIRLAVTNLVNALDVSWATYYRAVDRADRDAS